MSFAGQPANSNFTGKSGQSAFEQFCVLTGYVAFFTPFLQALSSPFPGKAGKLALSVVYPGRERREGSGHLKLCPRGVQRVQGVSATCSGVTRRGQHWLHRDFPRGNSMVTQLQSWLQARIDTAPPQRRKWLHDAFPVV